MTLPAEPHPLPASTAAASGPEFPTIRSHPGNFAYDQRALRPYLTVAAQLRSLTSLGQDRTATTESTPEGTNTSTDPVAAVIQLLMGLQGIVAASHFHRSDDERFSATTPLICRHSLSQLAANWEPYLIDGVARAVQSGATYCETLNGQQYRLTCVPIGDAQRPTAALCVFSEMRTAIPEIVELIVQLAAAELGRAVVSNSDTRHELADMLQRITTADNDEIRFPLLAGILEESLHVAQVFVATCKNGGGPVLRAVSGVATLTRSAPLVKQAEEVIGEAILRGEQRAVELSARKKLTQSELLFGQNVGALQMLTGPLRDGNGIAVGGWILVDDGRYDAALHGETMVEAARRHEPLVAGILSLLQSAAASWHLRLTDKAKQCLFTATRRQLVATICGLGLLLCVPLPHRLRCDGEMHPVTRRFVPAPYDGQLQEVLVKPGDVVSAGQVLARMDRREIEWQLSALHADYQRASKQNDAGMVARETAASQMAKLEMERISLERKLLENRLQHLEIKSPIDGVVLSGDPKTMEGARLSAGQSLFETAPLDEMLVEVLVPDQNISYVRTGQAVRLWLDAFPSQGWEGNIQRISPRSEARAGRNIFVADVVLDNKDRLIRPGMKGRCRVTCGRRLLGWILFHKPWNYLKQLLRR